MNTRRLHASSLLLVGSNIALIENMSSFFDDEFEDIHTCRSVGNSVDQLSSERITCVISQYRLSDSDGIELLKKVRDRHPYLPFVLFAVDGSEELAAEAFRKGATDYLPMVPESGNFSTAASRVEEAVEKAEKEKLKAAAETLVENGTDPVFIVDEGGSTKYLNPSARSLFGYESGEWIGENSLSFIHPDDREQVRAEFSEIGDNQDQVFVSDFRVGSEDGGWVDIEIRAHDHLDDPAVNGIIAVGRVITDRKQHEQKLSTLHRTVRRLMKAESDCEVATITTEAARQIIDLDVNTVYLLDDDGQRLVPATETPEGRELFGDYPTFNQGEGLVWDVFESQEPLVFDDVRSHPDVYNLETPIRSELILPLGDHGVFMAGSTESGEFDSRTVSLASILATTVETAFDSVLQQQELKEQQEKLVAQNNRLEKFSSMVAHDIRNPLSVAIGYLELAQEKTADVEEEIGEAVHALDRMERIIDDLLWLAQEGQEIGSRSQVELEEIAEEAWGYVDTHKAVLETECDVEVLADDDRFKQLFENLFRNAVEHGGPDVTIRVGTLENGFYVEDNGTGIPEQERDEVFEKSYSTEENGTGFGLFIVKTIAEAHGWCIEVDESADGGARFEITDVDLLTLTDEAPRH